MIVAIDNIQKVLSEAAEYGIQGMLDIIQELFELENSLARPNNI